MTIDWEEALKARRLEIIEANRAALREGFCAAAGAVGYYFLSAEFIAQALTLEDFFTRVVCAGTAATVGFEGIKLTKDQMLGHFYNRYDLSQIPGAAASVGVIAALEKTDSIDFKIIQVAEFVVEGAKYAAG